MKKYIQYLILILGIIITNTALADWTPPAPPENGGYVLDQTNKLSAKEISKLNHKIETINRTTKNEYGILILQSMDGASIEDVAQITFRTWGVGKKGLDNGILIVVALSERKSRIQVGSRIEGELPDLECNDILKQSLNPHLKKGEFYKGLDETLDSINSHIESRASAATDATNTAQNKNNQSAIFIGVLVIGGLLLIIGGVMLVGYFLEKRRKVFQYEVEQLKHPTPFSNSDYPSDLPVTLIKDPTSFDPTYKVSYVVPLATAVAAEAIDNDDLDTEVNSSIGSYDWDDNNSGGDLGGFGDGDSSGGGSSSDW